MARIAAAAGIKKHLTQRAVRRTYQDLARQVQVQDFVARAISGHATVEMHDHYSAVSDDEVRAGLDCVVLLPDCAVVIQWLSSANNDGGCGLTLLQNIRNHGS